MKKLLAASLLILSYFGVAPQLLYAQASLCPTLTSTLYRGIGDKETKGQVSLLQRFLSDYFDVPPEQVVTGYFGRMTHAYVLAFQKEKGIEQAGSVGKVTRAAILSACSAPQVAVVRSTASSSIKESTKIASGSLQVPLQQAKLPSPSIIASASVPTVVEGQFSLLSWRADNATRCSLSYGGIEEIVNMTDSKLVNPLETTEYTLTCKNNTGLANDSGPVAIQKIKISVSPKQTEKPTVSLIASPPVIGYTKDSILTWQATYATACRLKYGDVEEVVSTNGTKTVSPRIATEYALTCQNERVGMVGPSTREAVVVNVATPTCELYSNKKQYLPKESLTLSWTSRDATHAAFIKSSQGKQELPLTFFDRQGPTGSVTLPASVVGDHAVTLQIYNHKGVATCVASFSVKG